MNSILITGCNRGIGLGLVKTFVNLPKPPKHLFATCRDIQAAVELQQLANEHKNIHIIQIDIRNFAEYDQLVQQVSDVVKEEGLNVLFNNAGIASRSTRIHLINEKMLLETLTTNTVAPILLTKACLPLLRKASAAESERPLGPNRAAIINMSSILGSIEANVEGGMYPYRASKSALNSATKSLSIDLKKDNIMCVSVHPGWVKTGMGGSGAPLDVDTSCKAMVETILSMNESHNGGFYQFDGKKLNW